MIVTSVVVFPFCLIITENSCKTGDEMPALLQQLLCKETIAKLPVVPTRGAMSADQIEKQFLLGDAENGGAAEMSSENVRSACRKTRLF